MHKKKAGGLEWLEFSLLQEFEEVAHGVFLGQAKKEAAREALSLSCMRSARPVHGDRIHIPNGELVECDALVSSKRGEGLMLSHADCQIALFYDPVTKTIGNVHCGWRGQVQNLYGKTVAFMKRELGVRPENLVVCISPSLGPENSEFLNYRVELPKSFLPFKQGDCHFDLWAIAEHQLQEAGVLPERIEIARLCTFSHSNQFFSYRRDKKTGRHGTVIGLKACALSSK